MKRRRFRRTRARLACAGCLLLLWALPACRGESSLPGRADGAPPGDAAPRLTLLHTNDMHSHLLGAPNADYAPSTTGDGTAGGIARIAARVRAARETRRAQGVPTLLLDAGDFTMGTLFHLLEGEAEMGVLNRMGYDFICPGNHEFDWMPAGAARILGRASGPIPLCANLRVTDAGTGPGAEALRELMRQGKILPFAVKVLSGGLRAGVFGIMGTGADRVIYRPDPTRYPVAFSERIEAARRTAGLLRASRGADIVICLSHSGVDPDDHGAGEDPDLARAVPGIDVIVSGHSHTDMPEPTVMPGGTIVVQARAYASRLGVLDLEKTGGAWRMTGYAYEIIDDSLPGDPQIQAFVETCIRKIDDRVLRRRGYAFGQQLVRADFDLTEAAWEEHNLGDLVTDAIRWAVDRVENVPGHPRQGATSFSVESNGVIRDPILRGLRGRVNVSDVFRVVPLGFDPTASRVEDRAGYPLVAFYLTGREVRLAAEVNATLSLLLRDPHYWLSFSGLGFSYLSRGVPFFRVRDIYRCARPVGEDPACVSREELDTSKGSAGLYKVACNYYVGLNIGGLKRRSHGLLDVVPKDRRGRPIQDLTEAMVRRPDGTSVKEYEGVFDYLSAFPRNEAGVPVLPERYRRPQGRIVDACFVATVAFGSPLNAQVGTLRRFRDEVLVPLPGGQALIDLYYRHGGELAGMAAAHGCLRALARVLLLPVVGLAQVMLWLG